MRRPSAVPSVLVLLAVSLAGVGVATAATPSSQSVTASKTQVVKASWTGTVAAGVDSGGCGTSVGGNDTETLTYKVPAGLYDAVTTTTEIAVNSTADNDVDLQVTDAKGAVVGSSTGAAGKEKVALTDLPAGTYSVEVCTGSGPGDDYSAALSITPKARPAGTTPGAPRCPEGAHVLHARDDRRPGPVRR